MVKEIKKEKRRKEMEIRTVHTQKERKKERKEERKKIK